MAMIAAGFAMIVCAYFPQLVIEGIIRESLFPTKSTIEPREEQDIVIVQTIPEGMIDSRDILLFTNF